jgi:Txe/YoeB family toxin of Txe-Axe toxin-antitoxin module
MKYRATENFWKKFYRLPSEQKESVRSVWTIFKVNPFDPSLGTHRINSLSAQYKKTIYSVVVEADLRIVFYIETDTVHTVDIGTHSIYK